MVLLEQYAAYSISVSAVEILFENFPIQYDAHQGPQIIEHYKGGHSRYYLSISIRLQFSLVF